MPHQQEIVITTKNTTALTLGIVSLVLGVLALLVGWIPFLGLIAIPVAIIGGLLAFIGLVLAMVKGFKGAGMPILGGMICLGAIALPIFMTGSTSVAISEAAVATVKEMESQREQIAQEQSRQDEIENTEKMAYIDQKIDLYEVEAKYYGTTPGVEFKLKNNGDRTLNQVEITVYFMDADGSIIAEEDYYPVLVTRFSSNKKSLKPGYVWQQDKGMYYSARAVPSEWDEGKVLAKITDIEFAE